MELTWNAPDMNIPQNEEVTEEFEKYDPFTINGFGDWTVFDADGGETFVFGEVQNYWPNARTTPGLYDNGCCRFIFPGARS